jgi:hypothetical protein
MAATMQGMYANTYDNAVQQHIRLLWYPEVVEAGPALSLALL